jgi:hypothetical protein
MTVGKSICNFLGKGNYAMGCVPLAGRRTPLENAGGFDGRLKNKLLRA